MQKYNLTDKININNKEVIVKDLTLEDLYNLYERDKIRTCVKIINGDINLFFEEEE